MTGIPEVAAAGNLVSQGEGSRRTARFGTFELDVRSGELRRSGVKVKLQDQPLRLLVFLLEHPGEVITREEIRERLWPNEFVDFDHSLNTAIRKLRTALEDTADNPRFVETLARRGYRFIAPVSWVSDPQDAGEDTRAPRVGPAKNPYRAAIAIAIALLAALPIAWLIWKRNEPLPVTSRVTAIAVLPFANTDTWSEHVSDGLSEILIDTLSPIPDLRVMARTTVFEYKGKKIDPRQAAKELNVGAVVTGQVRRDKDNYRIHVELIDAKDGTQIWGNRYETTLADLASTQSRISGDLALQLRRGLGAERQAQFARAYTRNAEAYDLYLKGLQAWNRRSPEELRRAAQLFTQATEKDPGFAAAYAGIANVYGVMVGYDRLPAEQGTPLVLAAARRAIELDPLLAEPYVSIATTKFRNLWDFEGADQDYRKAISLNPNYATGHQWYADFLRSMGRFEEARAEIDLAYRLDPYSLPITSALCHSYVSDRRYDDAIAFARRARELDPRFFPRFCVATALTLSGRIEDLDVELERAAREGSAYAEAAQAALRKGGLRGFREYRLEAMLKGQSAGLLGPIEIAEQYALLGRHDEAMLWLEKAREARSSRLTSINVSPFFDGMRDDPRFVAMVKTVGLPFVDARAAKN